MISPVLHTAASLLRLYHTKYINFSPSLSLSMEVFQLETSLISQIFVAKSTKLTPGGTGWGKQKVGIFDEHTF